MKYFFRNTIQFLIVMGLITIILGIDMSFARELLPISGNTHKEYNAALAAPPKGQSGEVTAQKVIIAGLGYVKVIIAVIGVLFITIQGYRLLQASGEEEQISKARRGILYTIVAFVIISMSEDLAKIFDFEGSTLLSSPQDTLKRVRIFDREVEIVVTFVKYIIGSYATLMMVKAGFKLVTAGGDEELVTKQRKSMMYSIGGLLFITIGDIAVNKVFYKINKDVYSGINAPQAGVDVGEGVDQIVGITNLIVSFVGPVAVLMLIIGAVMYATAGGEEENLEKAKRVIMVTVIGIVIMYGAFALVSTVLVGRLQDVGAILQN